MAAAALTEVWTIGGTTRVVMTADATSGNMIAMTVSVAAALYAESVPVAVRAAKIRTVQAVFSLVPSAIKIFAVAA